MLLAYRSTPLSNGYSAAELLINTKLRRNVPSSRVAQKPHVPDRKLLVEWEEELRRKQKDTFECHHRAQDLLPALPGVLVFVPDRRGEGTIGVESAPRSYEVETPSGTFRRVRRDIVHLPAEDNSPRRPESQDWLRNDLWWPITVRRRVAVTTNSFPSKEQSRDISSWSLQPLCLGNTWKWGM